MSTLIRVSRASRRVSLACTSRRRPSRRRRRARGPRGSETGRAAPLDIPSSFLLLSRSYVGVAPLAHPSLFPALQPPSTPGGCVVVPRHHRASQRTRSAAATASTSRGRAHVASMSAQPTPAVATLTPHEIEQLVLDLHAIEARLVPSTSASAACSSPGRRDSVTTKVSTTDGQFFPLTISTQPKTPSFGAESTSLHRATCLPRHRARTGHWPMRTTALSVPSKPPVARGLCANEPAGISLN